MTERPQRKRFEHINIPEATGGARGEIIGGYEGNEYFPGVGLQPLKHPPGARAAYLSMLFRNVLRGETR